LALLASDHSLPIAANRFPGIKWGREYMLGILYIVVIGLIAGWATGKIMKGSGYGPLVDIVLGIVGAVVGGWILGLLGFYSTGGVIPSLLGV
jgi:uncharacterized membrane protein YeaQ/YmgE (transglycosylase-associated protein family)